MPPPPCRGRAAAAMEQRGRDRDAVDHVKAWALNTSTAALQAPVEESMPPAKRRRPEGKASRGGREADAGLERGSERAERVQEQE